MAPRISSPVRLTLTSVDVDEDAITPVTISYPPRPAPQPPLPLSPDRTLLIGTGQHAHTQADQSSLPRYSPQHSASSGNKWYSPLKKFIRGISGLLFNRTDHRNDDKRRSLGLVTSVSTKPLAVQPGPETRGAPILESAPNEYIRGKDHYHRTERNRLLCVNPLRQKTKSNEADASKLRPGTQAKETSRDNTKIKTSNNDSSLRRDKGPHKRTSIALPNGVHVANDHTEIGSPTSPANGSSEEEVKSIAARHQLERDELYERHRLQDEEIQRHQREELDALAVKQQAEREGLDEDTFRTRATAMTIRQPQDTTIAARPGLPHDHILLSIPTSQHDGSRSGAKITHHPPEGTIYQHQSPHPTLHEVGKYQQYSDEETEQGSISAEEHYYNHRAPTKQPTDPRPTASDPLPERQQPQRQQIHPGSFPSSPPTFPQPSPSRSPSPDTKLRQALKEARSAKQAAIIRRQYLEPYTPRKMRPLDSAEYTSRYGPPQGVSDTDLDSEASVERPLEPEPPLMGDVLGLSPSAFRFPIDPVLGRSDSERRERRVQPIDEHYNTVPETAIDRPRMREALEGALREMFRRIGLEAQMSMIEWLDGMTWGVARSEEPYGWVFPTQELIRGWEFFGQNWPMIERGDRRKSEDGRRRNAERFVVVKWERMPLSVLRTVWTYLSEWEDYWDRDEIARGRHFFPQLAYYHGAFWY